MDGSRRHVRVTERQGSERCAERGWRRTAAARLGARSKGCLAARWRSRVCWRRGSRGGAECVLLWLRRVIFPAAGLSGKSLRVACGRSLVQASAQQRWPLLGGRRPTAARGPAWRWRRLAAGLRLGGAASAAAAGRAAGPAAGGAQRCRNQADVRQRLPGGRGRRGRRPSAGAYSALRRAQPPRACPRGAAA